jgi:hypothetical protein
MTNDREILRSKIDEFIKTEESIIPILAGHIQNTVKWSRLKESERDAMIKRLDFLLKDSTRHKKILEGVKRKVETG